MRDVRIIQKMVLNGDVYRQVTETEGALRHRSEYDIGQAEERKFAILCWAIQESANGTHGTVVTLHGILHTLRQLREDGGV